MLTSTAMKAGFSGGLVVDFPNSTRAKKYFLVLMVGSSSYQPQAKGVNGVSSDEEQEVQVAGRQRSNKRRKTANGAIQVRLSVAILILVQLWFQTSFLQQERAGEASNQHVIFMQLLLFAGLT